MMMQSFVPGRPAPDVAAIRQRIADSDISARLKALLDELQRRPQQRFKSGRRKAADPNLIHLLNRTSFGVSPADQALAEQLGFEGYLEYQLSADQIDNTGLEGFLADLLPSLAMPYQEILDRLEDDDFSPAVDLIVGTIIRQLFSPRQLFEVMTEFWTNHFNVFLFDGPVQYLKTGDDRDNIRPHALGVFGDLLRANARSPAMLYYLDNYSNTRFGPNENYARELLELHTLGVDGGYTEFDVVEVARCFTGWTIDPRADDLFAFESREHDDEAKTVLGVELPAGQGIGDGEQVLELLLEQPATADFLAAKLCRRFVADEPPATLVSAVADTFRVSGGDIPASLRTLFLSPEFAASSGQKFRRPAELVGSLVRNLQPTEGSDYFSVIFRELETLGQLPFFSVPPTGYGDRQSDWLSTNSLLSRWNIGFSIAYGEVPVGTRAGGDGEGREQPMADYFRLDMFELLGGARTPAEIVDQLVDRILHAPVGSADRDALARLAADGEPSSVPLDLSQAVAAGRSVLSAILASRHFQNR
ncbi:MAG: DUF1800 domain-containing protein [Pseudomonadota bacterium]